MILGKRKRRPSIAQRRALTLTSFRNILQRVEAEAKDHPDDYTLQGIVFLCREFANKLRDDAAIS